MHNSCSPWLSGIARLVHVVQQGSITSALFARFGWSDMSALLLKPPNLCPCRGLCPQLCVHMHRWPTSCHWYSNVFI